MGRERERERCVGKSEEEGGTESQADSMPSVMPEARIDLTTLRSRLEQKFKV